MFRHHAEQLFFHIKMEPHERIRYVFYSLQRKLLIAVGHDFLGKDGFTPNSRTYFIYGLNALALASCIYTVIWYDISTGLNSLGYGAVNIQVTVTIDLSHTQRSLI